MWEVEQSTDYQVFKVLRKRESFLLPGLKEKRLFHTLTCPDWVNVICLTNCNSIALVRQFRHGVETYTYELPGGLASPSQSLLEAAKDELLEETGYLSAKWSYAGKYMVNAALQNNFCHTFVCEEAEFQAAPKDSEGIQPILVPIEEFFSKFHEGEFDQALILAAVSLAQRKGMLPTNL